MTTSARRAASATTLGLVVALILGPGLVQVAAAAPAAAAETPKRQKAKVVKVVDGDTIRVKLRSGRRVGVRMIGITAPPVADGTECGGPEARDNLERLLPRGRRVVLVSDAKQSNRSADDHLLRYVMTLGGRDVDRAQLKAGWALLDDGAGQFERVAPYRRSEKVAKSGERGVWGLCFAPPPSNLESTPGDSDAVSGVALALAPAGDRTVVAGKFDQVGTEPRSNVAAVRADGTVDPGFVADTDGSVHAVATSADGTVVFLGGAFGTVNGVPRANLAAVDATTGAVLQDWSADTGGDFPAVYSLAVHGDRLYVGGKFTEIDGTRRPRIGAVDVAEGDVVPAFDARANGPVREVVVTPDGSTIYVGGGFSKLSGAVRRGNAGAVSATDGSPTPFDPDVESGTGVVTVALSPDGSRFFLATQNNFVRAYDPAAGNDSVWDFRASGNTQAIAASGTEVYLGGHWTRIPRAGVERSFLGSVTLSDGALTSWDPQCDGDTTGVWGLLIQGGTLHAAGGFRSFGDLPRQGYARFSGTPTP